MRMFMIYLLMGNTNILRMAYLFTIAWMPYVIVPGQNSVSMPGMERITYLLTSEENDR